MNLFCLFIYLEEARFGALVMVWSGEEAGFG